MAEREDGAAAVKRMTWGDRAVEAAKLAQGFFDAGRVGEGIAAISLAAQMLDIQRNLDKAAMLAARKENGRD